MQENGTLGQCIDTVETLRDKMSRQREEYERWTKMYLLEVLAYVDRESREMVKDKVYTCSEIVGLIKIGVIAKSTQIIALQRQLKKANEKLVELAQVDMYTGRSTRYSR